VVYFICETLQSLLCICKWWKH